MKTKIKSLVALAVVAVMLSFSAIALSGCGDKDRDLGVKLTETEITALLASDSEAMLAMQELSTVWAGMNVAASGNIEVGSSASGSSSSLKVGINADGKVVFAQEEGDDDISFMTTTMTMKSSATGETTTSSKIVTELYTIGNYEYERNKEDNGAWAYENLSINEPSEGDEGLDDMLESGMGDISGMLMGMLDEVDSSYFVNIYKKTYKDNSYDINFVLDLGAVLAEFMGESDETNGETTAIALTSYELGGENDEDESETAIVGNPIVAMILAFIEDAELILTVKFDKDNNVTKIAVEVNMSVNETVEISGVATKITIKIGLKLTIEEFDGTIAEPTWLDQCQVDDGDDGGDII